MSNQMLRAADELRERVRERYAAAARAAAEGSNTTRCCGPQTSVTDASSTTTCGCGPAVSVTDEGGEIVFGGALYVDADTEGAPTTAVEASLGCGVPTAVADLHEGETVLDLGSGAGADVLISAKRVGPTGKAIGLDMTDEMLNLARANAAAAGIQNVEFVKGYIEQLPLPDASVDIVISNCVINLSADKPKVIAEAARVLRPGGRLAVSTSSPTPTWTSRPAPTWPPGRAASPARSATTSSSRRLRPPDSQASRSRRRTASTNTPPPPSSAPGSPDAKSPADSGPRHGGDGSRYLRELESIT